MLDSHGRGLYQKFLINPILPRVQSLGCTPQQITLAALCSGLMSLPFIAMNYPLLALIFLGLSGYLDTLDGSLARANGCSSAKGALFDIISDRVVECGVVLALFYQDPSTRAVLCICLLGSFVLCITSFLGVAILSENKSEKSFHYSPGIIERGESFLAFAILILFPQYFSLLATGFIFLVLLTAALRVRQFVQYT